MQIPNIFNQIDKIYIEKTGMPYSVSAAVGGSPKPQPQELTDVVFGPWEENSENSQYFSCLMSTEETLLFSEDPSLLPEGWYAIVTTDYGEIRLTVDDVSSENSMDIPMDTSDLTNMLYYTGSDETLATDIKFFDANGNLLYYCAQQNVSVEYYEEPTQKFTLNSVMIDGPYSGGPFSNVYDCHYDMTFDETPPANCEDGYGGYLGYAEIGGVCVADETGVIKDTGNYQINGLTVEHTHPDEYQYQNGDPTYPYGQTFGPATITITDNDGNIWGTATTQNVIIERN